MRGVAASILASAMVVCAVAQAIVLILVAPWSNTRDVLLHVAVEGTALLSAPLVLLLAWAVRPRTAASSASALIGASAPLTLVALMTSVWGTEIATDLGPVGAWVVRTSWLGALGPWIAFAAALRLSSLYPADMRERWYAEAEDRRPGLVSIVQTLAFEPSRLMAAAVLVPLLPIGAVVLVAWLAGRLDLDASGDVLAVVMVLGVIVWIGLVVLAAVRNFKQGIQLALDADQSKMLWSASGLIGAGSLVLLTMALWFLDILDILPEYPDELTFMPVLGAPLVIVIALYLAVFYEGGLDPRLVVRRGAITGAVTVFVTGLFALADVALSNLLTEFLPRVTALGGVAAGAVTAAAIGPIHGRVSNRVGAWMEENVPVRDLTDSPRHAAAVLSSHIIGYTALTSESEDDALTLMSVFHRAARKAAEQNKGRLVKTIGDEVLLEFKEPRQAVSAAQQLTTSFRDACAPLGLPTAQLRTGIHMGEVAKRRDGDLFGDAVNIASRLQGVAEPDQIIVS